MGDSGKTEVFAITHKSVLGRPRGKGPGITKHCQFGVCKTDSRCLWKTKNSSIHFIPFPKPCLEFRKGKTHEIVQCRQCSKARKWLDMCKRADGRFNELWHIKPYHYICSLHFVGGNGPSDSFPDPFSAHATQTKKNKLMKILEIESMNKLENESDHDDDLKENPSANVVYNTCQISKKEGSRHKLFAMADMFMMSSGCSVERTLEYLSIKLCSGMFVEKEFRFFELDSHLEIYVFNQLLSSNHNIYSEVKKIDAFTSGSAKLFSKVFNSWYSCIGIRDKTLIGMFNEVENKMKGIYFAAREAMFSLKCSMLIKHTNDESVQIEQCEECQKMNVSLTKALERKNQNNLRTNYNRMTYSELIKCLKTKSAQKNYYKQKLEKLGMLKHIPKAKSDSIEEEIVEDVETEDGGDLSVCTITFQDLDQLDASLSESELYLYNNTVMRSVLKPQKANVSNEPDLC